MLGHYIGLMIRQKYRNKDKQTLKSVPRAQSYWIIYKTRIQKKLKKKSDSQYMHAFSHRAARWHAISISSTLDLCISDYQEMRNRDNSTLKQALIKTFKTFNQPLIIYSASITVLHLSYAYESDMESISVMKHASWSG